MTEKEKILEELNKKLKQVQRSEGFFITITFKDRDNLEHFQCHSNFKQDDLLPSLNKIEKMVLEENPQLKLYQFDRTFN